ncbi:hypothetical protein [Kitasatospora sp. NRRL B-11411]|uniref:hypothetical protein n=1 Tax=Kitasatospora sp. NRRL B-11411 TaxID=1463822 RepID=UPI0004C3ECC1|nr:hypothetical protein [Kitasatospora sp. NRRL B-11411]
MSTMTLTRQDARLEAALGQSITALIANQARADAKTARVLDTHRALVAAETAVSFQRVRLVNVATAQRRVDDAVLDELDAQFEKLEEAAEERDALEADLVRLLQAREEEVKRKAAEATLATGPAPVPVTVSPASARRR